MKYLIGLFILIATLPVRAAEDSCPIPLTVEFCQERSKPKTLWGWAKAKYSEAKKSVEVAQKKLVHFLGFSEEAKREKRISKKLEDLPDYKALDHRKRKEELQNLQKGVEEIRLYALKENSVDREPELDRSDWELKDLGILEEIGQKAKPLNSPKAQADYEIRDLLTKSSHEAVLGIDPKTIFKRSEVKPVKADAIARWVWPGKKENKLELKPFFALDQQDFQLLAAKLFHAKKACHESLGLSRLALKAKKEPTAKEAASLNLNCLVKLKLYQQALSFVAQHLGKLEPNDHRFLQENFPEVLRQRLGQIYSQSGQKKKGPDFKYALALTQLQKGRLLKAEKLLKTIKAKRLKNKVTYALASIDFEKGHFKSSAKKFYKILTSKPKGSLKELATLNLARSYFQMKDFPKAKNLYHQIDKKSPFWITALIELGWAQIAMGDFSGAIGNMFSLHTPLFTSVYQPESYAIRSIGYLSLCQYPDAYKSLTFLENNYSQWLKQTSAFLKTKPKPKAVQGLYADFLNGKKARQLPSPVFREAGRQKKVTNQQKTLNFLIAEIKKVDSITQPVIVRLRLLEKRLPKEKTKSFISFYKRILKESQSSLWDLQKINKPLLASKRSAMKIDIGREILSQLALVEKDMVNVLENNEFLRFEVFSGSGENLRQLAGKKKRVPATAKPQSKDLRWAFEGEIWLDEIGHYRSELKNNCARQTARNH